MAIANTKSLDHLGLIGGFLKESNLAETVNQFLGLGQREVSFGHLMNAMVINGLGFTGRTLHMYPDYFKNKSIPRLLGIDVDPSKINDDALGRLLDAVFEYGPSKLYNQISEQVLDFLGIKPEALHMDSTSFHYDGRETPNDLDAHHIRMTRGYSRDHRPDLNQVVLTLICENQAGLPIYMQAASGNTQDSANFQGIIKSFIHSLKSAHSSQYLIGDAALYTQNSLTALQAQGRHFITRVPATNSQAKSVLAQTADYDFTPLNDGYRGVWLDSDYAGVAQKWLLLQSEKAKKQKVHLQKNKFRKEEEKIKKQFKALSQKDFFCASDAQKALDDWCSAQKYATVDGRIEAVKHYSGRGRPAKTQIAESCHYRIQGTVSISAEKQQEFIEQSGYFILSTNDLSNEMSMQEMLSHYKSQQKVEGGFRFLKHPDFLVNALFLKKPERIEALLMVMTVCLLVYAGLEHQIRKKLADSGNYFPDMKNKPSQRPTARWVFQCFDGIAVIQIPDQPDIVSNLEDRNLVILKTLGKTYQEIYS